MGAGSGGRAAVGAAVAAAVMVRSAPAAAAPAEEELCVFSMLSGIAGEFKAVEEGAAAGADVASMGGG